MQTATLEAVMKQTGQAPYGKSLKIKIVASDLVKSFTNEKGESKQVLNFAVADSTKATKAVCYDQSKFSKLKLNASLVLRNVIKKDNHIVLTTMTKCFRPSHWTFQKVL